MLGSINVKEGGHMALKISHNIECDNKLWLGEVALNDFEEYILTDDIMIPPLFDSYSDFIEHSWSDFVEDSLYS